MVGTRQKTGQTAREVAHAVEIFWFGPLDMAVVRESIHKRNDHSALPARAFRIIRRRLAEPLREMHIGESPKTIREETRSVAAMSDWRHYALCRDEDPELFFPIGTSGPALLQVEQAKAVCQRCSVTSECLQWALDSGQDAGVWGGMSEDERRLMKRRGGLRVRAHSA
jgi:WhiB family redox-sensing transcriptional regulator